MTKVNLGKDSSGRPLVVDARWLAKLRSAEAALGFKFTLVQGSWRGSDGAKASANTHARGGVVDLRTWDLPASITPQEAVLQLRLAGLISWYRTVKQGFDPHIHTIDYGNPDLDPSAARQVTSWQNGRNGLVSNGPDDGPRVNIPKAVPLRIDGVDLSHWQSGTLDFAAAKRAGVKWVFHKCTEGTKYVDDGYAARRVQAKKAGLPFGAYHFARPSMSGGKAQAQFFLSKATPVTGDMWPMLDLEDRAGTSRPVLSGWVRDFVREIKSQTGVPPFIYTSFDLDSTFGCPLWTARYHDDNEPPRIPFPWKSYTVHQFSDGTNGTPNKVAGFGNVDLNTMVGDPRTFMLGDEVSPADLAKIQAMFDASVEKTADRVLNKRIVVNKNPSGKEIVTTLSGMTTNIEVGGDRVETDLKTILAKLDALLVLLDKPDEEPEPPKA